jgi:small subunit ribosomal protein S16
LIDGDCIPVFEEETVAVRIRMKMMGRRHRHYFRIVAIDGRQPRDGRVIEELGTYDPHVKNTEERVTLIPSRIKYWMSVGAQPSENVTVFLKKYMAKWEQKEAEAAAAPTAPTPPPAGEVAQAPAQQETTA